MIRPIQPIPRHQPIGARRPGQPVCSKCGRGYGSKHDGICTSCRGGVTAWAAANGFKK